MGGSDDATMRTLDLKITPDAIVLSRGNEVLNAIDKRPARWE